MDEKCVAPEWKLLDICLMMFCNSGRLAALLADLDLSLPLSVQMQESIHSDSLRPCGKPIIESLLRHSNLIQNYALNDDGLGGETSDDSMKQLDDLVALATEKFYAFPSKHVPHCWRSLFREASLLKFSMLVVKGICGRDQLSKPCFRPSQIDEMVKSIDMALIMAGPPTSSDLQDSVTMALELLQKIESSMADNAEPAAKLQNVGMLEDWNDAFSSSPASIPSTSRPITREKHLSFGAFERLLHYPQHPHVGPEPVIITDCLDHWPARSSRPWSNPSYLLSKTMGGRRLVPIEIGRSYVDEDWSQKIVTFRNFLNSYIIIGPETESKTGYLAQHNLFAQIPSLREDIAIPDYCFACAPSPHESSPLANRYAKIAPLDEPLLNAWLGPAGTITPLHTDPYHNILAQVVGKKYVRLYAPCEGKNLYARGIEDGGVDMGNTSAMDIGVLAGWDGTSEDQKMAHRRFPLFKSAQYVDCVLMEGECLYIPVGWWHYVRSLSISFSVSFWFN